MKMPMSHSKMRIRPSISEIFFLVVRWFSIRQFCSLLFILFGWFVWYVKLHGWKQLKSTVANVGRAWFFLCPYFLTAGWFRRHRNCMLDLEQRKNEVWQSHAGTALRLLPTRLTRHLQSCHSGELSWLRALAIGALLDTDSQQKGEQIHLL